MMIILRHVVVWVISSVFITTIVLATTFVAFPPDDWMILLEHKIYDVPFWGIMLGIPTIFGTIIGTTRGLYWKQRLSRIDRQLNKIIKGQKLIKDEEKLNDISFIEESIEQIQNKFDKQIEHAQKQATERIEEREKGLQEVVIQERNRLARELHDSVSQQLFAASMMMSAINETNPPEEEEIRKQLSMIEKAIHQSQLEMRALLLHLRPVALKGKNLQIGAEELLLELIQKVPMEIDWKIEPFIVDKGIEDQLFRILQESVSNTLRHAKASRLHVMLIERDETVILRVVDDGIGFNINKVKTSSYGVENMRERAYEIGGTFKVISLPDEGTRLEVKVPILRKEGEDHD